MHARDLARPCRMSPIAGVLTTIRPFIQNEDHTQALPGHVCRCANTTPAVRATVTHAYTNLDYTIQKINLTIKKGK